MKFEDISGSCLSILCLLGYVLMVVIGISLISESEYSKGIAVLFFPILFFFFAVRYFRDN